MSVMMGLRIDADPARVEEALNSDPERLKRIANVLETLGASTIGSSRTRPAARSSWSTSGLTPRRSCASSRKHRDVGPMLAEAGVTARPTPVFWREMDTPDKF